MKKSIFKDKKRIIGTTISIIAIIVSFFVGKSSNNINTGYNEGIIATDIQEANITQATINPISPLELENQQHWQDNEAKIIGFFRYWNDEEYFRARNNIASDISKIFTEEKMSNFRNDMTKYFEIVNISKRGVIANSEFYVSTKHNVELYYQYLGKNYVDKLLIVVGRKKEDLKQHHITQMSCDLTNGPICTFLKSF